MRTRGICIFLTDNVLKPNLSDILNEIPNGSSFHWAILFLYATGHLKNGGSIPEFEKEIYNSEKGYEITWHDLNVLAPQFYQIIDITIIGCKDQYFIKSYEVDQEMFETCDLVIEMLDGGFWQIFAKNDQLIELLASKFPKTEFLESIIRINTKNNEKNCFNSELPSFR